LEEASKLTPANFLHETLYHDHQCNFRVTLRKGTKNRVFSAQLLILKTPEKLSKNGDL